jgi:hypothetical protein
VRDVVVCSPSSVTRNSRAVEALSSLMPSSVMLYEACCFQYVGGMEREREREHGM